MANATDERWIAQPRLDGITDEIHKAPRKKATKRAPRKLDPLDHPGAQAYWTAIPERWRIDRAYTAELFVRLGDRDQRLALAAVPHYVRSLIRRFGDGDIGKPTPSTMLKNRFWKDFDEAFLLRPVAPMPPPRLIAVEPERVISDAERARVAQMMTDLANKLRLDITPKQGRKSNGR